MGLNSSDLARLGPHAQKQVLQKLGAQQRQRENKGKKPNKYNAKPTDVVMPDGTVRHFSSEKEANRFRELDLLQATLTGNYVAQSDFGTYLEKTSQEIEADPTKLERYFRFAARIRAEAEQVGVDFAAYKTDVEGYIRQGIVGYDGTTPIIGIAIGQDIRTTQTGVETERGVFDEIDKSSNMSVWTTEKLSFYIGGQEAAYFSNGKLTVAQIATDRITGSGKWDVSFTSGVKYKWIGG